MKQVYAFWSNDQLSRLESMFFGGYTDREIGAALGKSRKAIHVMRKRIGLYRDLSKAKDNLLSTRTVDPVVCCRQHLVDLMREVGGETLGEAKAAYRSRCEVSVDPGYSARFHGNVYSVAGSGCGSPAFMCMGD